MGLLFCGGSRKVVQTDVISQTIAITIICGPTGVGKSAYAVQLAHERNGEIVNADSQQVYRGCDIGTGKLMTEQREGVPHYCIDLIEPHESYDGAKYVRTADAAILEINARGRLPIVCGGTGLYLKSLVYGLCEAPPADTAYRRDLQQMIECHGVKALYEQLRATDPAAARIIHPRHSSRIMRALEIFRATGRSILELHAAHANGKARYKVEWVCLEVAREQLYKRINVRVEEMIARGWVDEVRSLLGMFGPDAPGLRSIGYKELISHIRGEISLPQAIELIKRNTRRYAKRQMTWFQTSLPRLTIHL